MSPCPPSVKSLQAVYSEVASLHSLLVVICVALVQSLARFFTAPLSELQSLVSFVHGWRETSGDTAGSAFQFRLGHNLGTLTLEKKQQRWIRQSVLPTTTGHRRGKNK